MLSHVRRLLQDLTTKPPEPAPEPEYLTDVACAAGCLAVIVREAYLSAAEYVGASCRYTEVYGVDTNLNLGGGAQEFTFRRSAQVTAVIACLM
jgi:hypothetical protein